MGGAGFGAAGLANTLRRDISKQSMRALQELGIVVGVAFLVGGLFYFFVLLEKFAESRKQSKIDIIRMPHFGAIRQ